MSIHLYLNLNFWNIKQKDVVTIILSPRRPLSSHLPSLQTPNTLYLDLSILAQSRTTP